MIILLFFTTILLLGSQGGSAVVFEEDSPVDNDTQIDKIIGDPKQTSFTDAQVIDGTTQNISEVNVGADLTDWEYFKNIVIDQSKVSIPLQNFPVLVSIFDQDLKSQAQSDGDDIAFFDDTGSQLDHDLSVYNSGYNETHAQLITWVKADLYDNQDTTLMMVYGNNTMTSQENPMGVWTGNYNDVWHMEESPDQVILDELLTNNGTSSGSMTSDDLVLGKIGYGIEFDGVDDFINVKGFNTEVWDAVTLSAWVNDYATNDGTVFAIASGTGRASSVIAIQSRSGETRNRLGTDGAGGSAADDYTTAGGSITHGTWYHITLTWDAASEQVKIYLNGQNVITVARDGDTLIDDTTVGLGPLNGTIGNIDQIGDSRYLSGIVDELRFGNKTKSAGWISTEYNNQNDPSSFYSVSEQKKRGTIALIDSYNIDVDDIVNLGGGQTNTYNMRYADGITNFINELNTQSNTYSVQSSGDKYFKIGDGSVPWNSPQGTISFNFQIDTTSGNQYLWGLNSQMNIIVSSGVLSATWGDTTLTSGTGLGTGGQNFVAVTWDEINDNLFLYWSESGDTPTVKASDTSWTDSVSSLSVTENNFMASHGGNNPMDGEADELRYYDVARSTSEIQSDHLTSLSGKEPNLRSYYHFEQNLIDLGSNNDEATAVNGIDYSITFITSSTKVAGFGQEFQFQGIPFEQIGAELTIKTGTLGSEDLAVDYWNGTNWITLFTDLIADSWNNITLNDLSLSSTFSIRLRDGNRGSDASISSWYIDTIQLQLTNYDLQWEHQSQDLTQGREYYFLTIFGNSTSNENFNVEIWNQSSLTWTVPYTIEISNSQWYNISLPHGIINTEVTWRYIGTNLTRDTISDTLFIDYAGINSYNIKPTLSSPVDMEFEQGDPGLSFDWTFDDENPSTYKIYRNGSLITSNTWASETTISINTLDKLLQSTYNYTIEVIDQYGTTSVDSLWVKVNDNLLPTLNSPKDFVVNESSSNNQFTWTFSDESPKNYTVYQNDVIISSSSWSESNNTYTFNMDPLSKGVYNVTIIVFDRIGQYRIDSVQVTIRDDNPPVISSSPDNLTYEQGDTNNWLNWTASDSAPDIYTIYRNGSIVEQGDWISDINYNVDGLPAGTYNFTIRIYDHTPNVVIDWVLVTVTDTTPPTVSSPADFSYKEGTEGNSVSWDVYDLNPETLTIYRNGSSQLTIGWTTSTISISIDDLSIGTYNYTIVVRDTFGNIVTDTVFVTVFDDTLPVINSPNDVFYTLGGTGNSITWVGSDLHPFNYQLFRNGSVIQNGYWIANAAITFNIDGLSLGVYNYTLVIYDSSGNSASDMVIVEVSNFPIFDATPSDIDYVKEETGNYLNWTIVDSNPSHYIIYRNGTEVQSGTWGSGEIVSVLVDGLDYGMYNFTIWANDTDGNAATDMAYVKVTDLPNLITSPGYQEYSEGTGDVFVYWNATDLEPTDFEIYRNGSIIDSGVWDNATEVELNIGGLSFGIYNYTIIFYDASLNQLVNQFLLNVTDTTLPSINTPNDITYVEDSTSNSITWSPSDNHPGMYEIYQNNTYLNASATWTSGMDIVFDIDGLPKGVYNFTIYLYDSSGNFVTDTVVVTVLDTNSPTILGLQEGEIAEKDLSTTILEWEINDNYPLNYTIYLNSTEDGSGFWDNNNNITYSLDGLSKGFYNITLVVFDESGNFASITYDLTVIDNTNPSIISTPSQTLFFEYQNNIYLNWTAFDKYNHTYTIELDGQEVQSGFWADDISYDISDLTKGSYNVVITFYDESGNFIQDTVSITVFDDTAPTFTDAPSNTTLVEGENPKFVNFTGSDAYPFTYEIYVNGTLNITDVWGSGIEEGFDITNYPIGIYNITIVIADESGNTNSHTVWITIVDETDPVSNSPDDMVIGEIGSNSITWNATDLHPATYEIFQNHISIETGQWNLSSIIDVDLSSLDLGDYNFTIVFYDDFGNFVVDTVLVTVSDLTDPSVDTSNSTLKYQEGETSNQIGWNISDLHLVYYEIYNNSVLVTNVTVSGQTNFEVLLNVDGLSIGEYSFTIYVYDNSTNFATNTITVNVIELVPPTIIEEPTNQTVSETNSSVILTWIASDTYNDTYQILLDGVGIDSGFWESNVEITLNVSALDLSLGEYTFTILIYDTSSNLYNQSVTINIIDNTPPKIIAGPDLIFESGDTGNQVYWNVSDKYDWIYYTSLNSETNGPFVGIDYSIISRNVDSLAPGEYNYTLEAIDENGNVAIYTITIIVQDNSDPVLQSITVPDNSTYAEGTIGNSISWVFTDENPSQYNVSRNGTTIVINANWVSGGTISLNIDGLTKGVYFFNITIWDVENNVEIVITQIIVIDSTSPEFSQLPTINEISEGSTSNELNWVMTDPYSDYYVVYRNGTEISSNTWQSNVAVKIYLDGLSKGTYNYTIVVYDQSGNYALHTQILEVVDTTSPSIITSPNIGQYVEGESSYELTWLGYDLYPATYDLIIDGEFVYSGSWFNNASLNFDITGLPFGNYNYTLVLVDESGNIMIDSFIFNVEDINPPTITSAPESIVFDKGTTGNDLVVEVTDLNPDTVVLIVDGDIYISRNWNGGTFVFSLDDFEIGEYSLRIEFYDQGQNKVQHDIDLRVRDPEVTDTQTPDIDPTISVFEGDRERIEGVWLDINGQPVSNAKIDVEITQQVLIEEFEIFTNQDGSYVIVLDYTDYLPGEYLIHFNFSKVAYQSQDDLSFPLTVNPHSFSLQLDYSDRLIQGEEYLISAIVYYSNEQNNNSLGLSLSFIEDSRLGTTAAGIPVSFVVTLIDTNDRTSLVTQVIETNQDGVAVIKLSSQDTLNLKSIQSIEVTIESSNFNLGYSFTTTQLPIPQPPAPELFVVVIDFSIEYLWAILSGIITLFVIIYVLIRRRRREQMRIKLLNESVKFAHDEINAIRGIETLIIQTTHSLNIYTEQINPNASNSHLVGGMVNALSSFLDHIGESQLFGFETVQRNDVSVTIRKSKYTNFIVISKSKLPFNVLSQIEEVQDTLEKEYKNYLEKSQRGVQMIKAPEMYQLFAKSSFKIGLTHRLEIRGDKIQNLLKERFISPVLKKHIEYLKELGDRINDYENGLYVEDIFEYLKTKEINRKTISRIIILAYMYDIIDPQIEIA